MKRRVTVALLGVMSVAVLRFATITAVGVLSPVIAAGPWRSAFFVVSNSDTLKMLKLEA